MNTTRIAHYYPAYCDMLRQASDPTRLLTMMENLLRAETLQASPTRYSVALCNQEDHTERFNHLGMATRDAVHEFVPSRVHRWAATRLPRTYPLGELPAAAGWLVSLYAGQRAAAGVPGQPVPSGLRVPSQFVYYQGGLDKVLPVLRGLEAYQRKRRKRARKLLAQLWAYHWRQQPVAVLASQEGGLAA